MGSEERQELEANIEELEDKVDNMHMLMHEYRVPLQYFVRSMSVKRCRKTCI